MRLSLGGGRARLGFLALVVCQLLAAARASGQCSGCTKPSLAGPRSYDLPNLYSYSASPIAAGDFNNDGYPDVVIYDGSSGLEIFPGTPTGSFGAPIKTTITFTPQSIALADFDGDGNLDVVASGSFGTFLNLFRGDGTGALLAPITISTPSTPLLVAAGDFNGDQVPDLVLTHSGAPWDVTIMKGNGDGTFQPEQQLATNLATGQVAVVDLNGDGKLDLVLLSFPKAESGCFLGGVTVLSNRKLTTRLESIHLRLQLRT